MRTIARKPGSSSTAVLTSATRALRVLKAFSPGRTELGVTELSHETGFSKSTAHLLLATLHGEGFVERNPVTGRYRLGMAAVQLGTIALDNMGFGAWAQAILEDLTAATGECTTIAVLDGQSVLFIQRVESHEILRVDLRIGTRLPLHASAIGKVLLAFTSEQEREALLAEIPLPPVAPRTLTEVEALRTDLARVARLGFAVSIDEVLPRISALAAPVWNGLGRVAAGVSVAGPTGRFVPEHHVEHVLHAAQRLSTGLGYVVRQDAPAISA